jgi:hypothetical protein
VIPDSETTPGSETTSELKNPPRRGPPRSHWLAHAVLILAAVALAGIAAGRGDRELLRYVNIGIMIILVLILVVQITIARRTRGAWGSVLGSAISALGVLCLLLAQFASVTPTGIALTAAGAVRFIAAAVTFWLQAGRARRLW